MDSSAHDEKQAKTIIPRVEAMRQLLQQSSPGQKHTYLQTAIGFFVANSPHAKRYWQQIDLSITE